MKEYRYIKEYVRLKGTVLKLWNIYRIKQISKYNYEVYSREYDIKICDITEKMLNHFFEEIK